MKHAYEYMASATRESLDPLFIKAKFKQEAGNEPGTGPF